MYFPEITESTGGSGGVQMGVIEAVALIITISAIVLFAITLAGIAWLCFCEPRQSKHGRSFAQEIQRENDRVSLLGNSDDGSRGAHSWSRASTPQHTAWAR